MRNLHLPPWGPFRRFSLGLQLSLKVVRTPKPTPTSCSGGRPGALGFTRFTNSPLVRGSKRRCGPGTLDPQAWAGYRALPPLPRDPETAAGMLERGWVRRRASETAKGPETSHGYSEQGTIGAKNMGPALVYYSGVRVTLRNNNPKTPEMIQMREHVSLVSLLRPSLGVPSSTGERTFHLRWRGWGEASVLWRCCLGQRSRRMGTLGAAAGAVWILRCAGAFGWVRHVLN